MCEGFFWTLFVWWDVPKKPWQCGGRCQTYGFPFDLASWASSVEGFFWTLFVCEGFFWNLLCGGTFQKKPWQCGGRCSVFWSGFFSDLSGIVPCQTSEFPFDLASWASNVRRLFLDPFCVRRLFLDPFCVVGRSKKNLGSGGAGVPFSGQVFCQTFLE